MSRWKEEQYFFDGYKADPAYATACLRKALEARADLLVLCDTNGGTLPGEIGREIGRASCRERV